MPLVQQWLDAEDVKCSIFCLTLAGDAHIWYASVGNDWNNLQRLFHRQFSKHGQTQEEVFQRWISFQFDQATGTINSCVVRFRQCAQKLKYNENHILELFG